MGERQNQPFQLSFNASLKIDFQGSRVTSDGGPILVRELDERLGLGDLIGNRAVPGRDIASRTRCREEASHVLQHIDLADPQSSRRLR
jgi:hypothetical protein